MWQAGNSVKNLISNPKPDLQNINIHLNFDENPLTFTQSIIRKLKYGWTDLQQMDGYTEDQQVTIILLHCHMMG